jgi:hypothetical protein
MIVPSFNGLRAFSLELLTTTVLVVMKQDQTENKDEERGKGGSHCRCVRGGGKEPISKTEKA